MTCTNPCHCDPQCETPAAWCDRCEGEMYAQDTVYEWENTHICGTCMEEEFRCMTTREKAALLGAYPVRAGAVSPDCLQQYSGSAAHLPEDRILE